MQETGPSVYRPFSRSFERLSICKFLEKPAYFKTLSVGLVWGFSPDPPVQQSRLSEDVIKSRDQGDWNLAPHAHFSNDLRKVLRCQSHSSLRKLWEHFLSSHVTRSVHWWSLFKAHESLLVYKVRAFLHKRKRLLFRKISCHHQHFASATGLLRLDKFWPKRTNLQTHRRCIFQKLHP